MQINDMLSGNGKSQVNLFLVTPLSLVPSLAARVTELKSLSDFFGCHWPQTLATTLYSIWKKTFIPQSSMFSQIFVTMRDKLSHKPILKRKKIFN